MILYWYMHWFWITLLRSGFVLAYPTQSVAANDDSLVRPVGKSLSPNSNLANRNLIHPNRTVTDTHNATDTKPRSTSSMPTPLRTAPATLSTVLDALDHFKNNDVFSQTRVNVPEVDKATFLDSSSPHNDTSNIIAMGYTNNSFEDNINNTIANDTEMLEAANSHVSLNISHSFMANSNLIDISDGNIGPHEGQLSAAGITGITVGCICVVGLLSAVSFLLYRYRTFNRPDALNDYCSNLDSSGYIDDTSIRDNSEEMYSLDNDSFLNSLEAMTIQNYWTDKVKHTKL